MPVIESRSLISDFFKVMRRRISDVWPEVIEEAEDASEGKVRGIFSLDEMGDTPFAMFEAPFCIIYVSSFDRSNSAAMDSQEWRCLLEIIYVRSPEQTSEELMERMVQLQIYLETYPNDVLDGVGQIARVHGMQNARGGANAAFIERHLPSRAAAMQVEAWISNDPLPLGDSS
jgi:hypothetical protein